MVLLKLLPIDIDEKMNTEFQKNTSCSEILKVYPDFYGRVGFHPPWVGYFAIFDGIYVGSAGFKYKPKNGKVEIAYGTFKQYEGRGIGKEICRQLVFLALKANPEIRITARTLPENNASIRVLKKNGFEFSGEVMDEEDGLVWEWTYMKELGTSRSSQ